jgi:hypothetical protein
MNVPAVNIKEARKNQISKSTVALSGNTQCHVAAVKICAYFDL